MEPPLLTPEKPRRRLWPWLLLGCGVLLSPFVILAMGAVSVLTLDSDAASLRREVVRAAGGHWNTKVQGSAGSFLIDAVRTGLIFAPDEHAADARLALSAVRNASVGVYERSSKGEAISTRTLIERTDRRMRDRGWSRLVGVVDHGESVLIYSSDEDSDGDHVRLCLAVVDGNQLVVVSTEVASDELAELVVRHAPQDWKKKFAGL